MDVVDSYISAGVGRVIIGTAAVKDEPFLVEALKKYGDKIAVGADVKDGRIAIKGWLETSEYTLDAFLMRMVELGVKTVICTDISKDGAMKGTNLQMYKELSEKYGMEADVINIHSLVPLDYTKIIESVKKRIKNCCKEYIGISFNCCIVIIFGFKI